MSRIIITIYVAGNNMRSRQTISLLKEASDLRLGKNICSLVVEDIIKSPELAEAEKILAIPTISRKDPQPEKRIIGEINDLQKAISVIDFLVNDLPNHTRYA